MCHLIYNKVFTFCPLPLTFNRTTYFLSYHFYVTHVCIDILLIMTLIPFFRIMHRDIRKNGIINRNLFRVINVVATITFFFFKRNLFSCLKSVR